VTPSADAIRARAVRLWRLDDNPAAWSEAPRDTLGYGGAIRVTTPPHGATVYVALRERDHAALIEAVERAERVEKAARDVLYEMDCGGSVDGVAHALGALRASLDPAKARPA
jgi:hypothetical protein